MDKFKAHIQGFRGAGKTCECCREVKVDASRKLARNRLKAEDRKDAALHADKESG
jgi:hypothetical protein